MVVSALQIGRLIGATVAGSPRRAMQQHSGVAMMRSPVCTWLPLEYAMPSVRTSFTAAVAILAACFAAAGSPATASAASCDYTQTSELFASWQDFAAYTPFQGASFENGASGWSWGNGAKIVNGDSNTLLASLGTHSVEVPGGGTARSPWMCVNSTTPSMRFFVRRVSGTGDLTIKSVVSTGTNKVTTLTTITAASDQWQPSPVVVFPPFLTTSYTGINVQFQFTADPGSVFHVDDVELDPYLRR